MQPSKCLPPAYWSQRLHHPQPDPAFCIQYVRDTLAHFNPQDSHVELTPQSCPQTSYFGMFLHKYNNKNHLKSTDINTLISTDVYTIVPSLRIWTLQFSGDWVVERRWKCAHAHTRSFAWVYPFLCVFWFSHFLMVMAVDPVGFLLLDWFRCHVFGDASQAFNAYIFITLDLPTAGFLYSIIHDSAHLSELPPILNHLLLHSQNQSWCHQPVLG